MGEIIVKHGPDLLRRVAQLKGNLIEGAQEWAKKDRNPAAPSFDEVLATLVAEEAKAATAGEEDETFDHGSRDLPPNLPDEDSDADWIAQAKREDDEDAEEPDGGEAGHMAGAGAVENKADDDEASDDDLPPEVERFFTEATRMTAGLFVGLNDEAMTPEKRKALNALVLQLVTKMMFFKRSLVERARGAVP